MDPNDGAVRVFYHVCATGDAALDVVRDQACKLLWSGVYDAAAALDAYVCGPATRRAAELLRSMGSKWRVHERPADASFERLTLLEARRACAPGDRVLYLHSKGVTRAGDQAACVRDWRDVLELACVKEWRACVTLLDVFDAVGANGRAAAAGVPRHFSGNFWWATGAHLKRLPPEIGPGYVDPEMWVGREGRLWSVLDTCDLEPGGVNHYETRCPLARVLDGPRRGRELP